MCSETIANTTLNNWTEQLCHFSTPDTDLSRFKLAGGHRCQTCFSVNQGSGPGRFRGHSSMLLPCSAQGRWSSLLHLTARFRGSGGGCCLGCRGHRGWDCQTGASLFTWHSGYNFRPMPESRPVLFTRRREEGCFFIPVSVFTSVGLADRGSLCVYTYQLSCSG